MTRDLFPLILELWSASASPHRPARVAASFRHANSKFRRLIAYQIRIRPSSSCKNVPPSVIEASLSFIVFVPLLCPDGRKRYCQPPPSALYNWTTLNSSFNLICLRSNSARSRSRSASSAFELGIHTAVISRVRQSFPILDRSDQGFRAIPLGFR